MARIEIRELLVDEELAADEQRELHGGYIGIAGIIRYLQPKPRTYTDMEMLGMLATSQEA
jgi:hypothetical protein